MGFRFSNSKTTEEWLQIPPVFPPLFAENRVRFTFEEQKKLLVFSPFLFLFVPRSKSRQRFVPRAIQYIHLAPLVSALTACPAADPT